MRSAWLEIDVGAYEWNLRELAALTAAPVKAVVKANAYGHGLQRLARAAIHAGAAGVAVALPEEGAALREAGQLGRILVLGLALEDQAELMLRHELEAVVTRPEMLRAFAAAAHRVGRPAGLHVKVDTGMTRVGVEPEETVRFCRDLLGTPGLRLLGVMTHFACADAASPGPTDEQWKRFAPVVQEIGSWDPRPLFHAANSAAALWYPPTRLDFVRAGLVTYGVNPGPHPLPVAMRPVASLKVKVVQVRDVPAGRSVSYGGTWTAPRPSRLALLPVGYADGLPWALGNRGEALLHGRPAPIRGRVCMDQVVVDVTDHPPVQVGDEAVLIGRQAGLEITLARIADLTGTIPYEVMTGLAARLPRIDV